MFLGGMMMVRLGINRALWVFGVLQMVGISGFAILSYVGKSYLMLNIAVIAELLTIGLGTTAYSAFMAIQTNKRFTATQFALMTSLMAVPGTFVASLTGFMVKYLGWSEFYWVCILCAIPGTLLLMKVAPWNEPNPQGQLIVPPWLESRRYPEPERSLTKVQFIFHWNGTILLGNHWKICCCGKGLSGIQ